MAQRISRAKRTVADVRFDEPGDLATVLRVLYLVFNEGYTGDVDLAAEAIRLTRQLASMTDDEEVAGLLALMLLHHARRAARTRPDGSLVPLAEQDRSPLGHRADRRGRRRPAGGAGPRPARRVPGPGRDRRAARRRAARRGDRLGADRRAGTTSCCGSPTARSCALNRAVAVGEADGARAGLAALAAGRPGAAPAHRRVGVPAREGRRPRDRGPALRRRRPRRAPTSPSATT